MRVLQLTIHQRAAVIQRLVGKASDYTDWFDKSFLELTPDDSGIKLDRAVLETIKNDYLAAKSSFVSAFVAPGKPWDVEDAERIVIVGHDKTNTYLMSPKKPGAAFLIEKAVVTDEGASLADDFPDDMAVMVRLCFGKSPGLPLKVFYDMLVCYVLNIKLKCFIDIVKVAPRIIGTKDEHCAIGTISIEAMVPFGLFPDAPDGGRLILDKTPIEMRVFGQLNGF